MDGVSSASGVSGAHPALQRLLIQTCSTQQTQNICIKFIQCRSNVEDVGPTLYKCYANVCVCWDITLPGGGDDKEKLTSKNILTNNTVNSRTLLQSRGHFQNFIKGFCVFHDVFCDHSNANSLSLTMPKILSRQCCWYRFFCMMI